MNSLPLLPSIHVRGAAVLDLMAFRIGTVEDLILDSASGRIAYALIRFSNLDHENALYPVPWAAIQYENYKRRCFRTEITKGQVAAAPAFDDVTDMSREWELKVHRHFGVPPYWQPDSR